MMMRGVKNSLSKKNIRYVWKIVGCVFIISAIIIGAVVERSANPKTFTANNSPADSYDWTALTNRLQSFVPGTVNGLSFMIARNGQPLYSRAFGNLNVDSVLPIASSTKMPSGLAIMTLVDSGQLNLDEPVGTYLAGRINWPADKAAITMRMLLNHTSGLDPDAPCLNNQLSTTLQNCAQEIANAPLEFEPGAYFAYGGGSFQVAGYVAEVISGMRWNEFFAERVGNPLGLTRFTYTVTDNPRIAGGARSDTGDYTRIMQMFLAGGVYGSTRVLSAESVAVMRANQIAGIPKLRSPGGTTLTGYSFGWWFSEPRLHPGSRGPELSDQGAFGCTPWIDLDLNYSAALLIYRNMQTGTNIWNQVRPLIIEQMIRNPPPANPIQVVLLRDATNQLQATIIITNPLADPVPGVQMTLVRASTLDGSQFVDGVPVPQSFGTINPGQSVTTTVTFPGTAGVPSGFSGLVRVDLSYTGGTYTDTKQVITP